MIEGTIFLASFGIDDNYGVSMKSKLGFNPIGKHPKPKSKGKKPKAPKIKTGKKISSLDLFFTSLDADAGSESSKSKYVDSIKKLSKGQLNKLDRLIKKIRRKRLMVKIEPGEMDNICNEIEAAIEDRIQASQLNEATLSIQIEEKLLQLDVHDVEFKTKKEIRRVCVDDQWMSLRRFIQRYFEDEINYAKQLMEDGQLITPNIRHGSFAFIKRFVYKHLIKVFSQDAR